MLTRPLLPFLNKGKIEAGCDEAGRGCLAGPVFAAAVVLAEEFSHPLLNDSKQLSEAKRYELRTVIEEEALSFAVASVNEKEIDDINILNASFLAMHRAIEKLNCKVEHLIIDGNRFNSYKNIPHTCLVKGDARFLSIAAASILAKTYRDDYMLGLHDEYTVYDWNQNKGYPTAVHRRAIADHGISPYHRKSFRLLPEQLSLGL